MKRKARERFNDLIDPMINIAGKLAEDALSGRMSHSDQMRLVAFIADRTGFAPGREISVEVEVKPWEQTMERIIRVAPLDLIETVGSSEEPVDAELVEDEDERVHPRDFLPQIIPPTLLNERATIRIGSPLDRPRPHLDNVFED